MHDTVCNETALGRIIQPQDPEDLDDISRTLCNLTDAQLDEFSKDLWESLDKQKIIDWVKDIEKEKKIHWKCEENIVHLITIQEISSTLVENVIEKT